MAKKMCIGVSDKAQKSKKLYLGVSNVARKIKKMYIGVNGVARCFYSGAYKVILLDSNHTFWSSNTFVTNEYNAATTVGDYALFGGGRKDGYVQTNLYSINKSLVATNVFNNGGTKWSISHLCATSIGDYALFGGGRDNYTSVSSIHVYDKSLTYISGNRALKGAAHNLAATTVGDYALFGGGENRNSSGTITQMSSVTAIDKSLTVNTNVSNLAIPRADITAVSLGGYALFPYGNGTYTQYQSTNIETYNSSLTRGSIAGEGIKRIQFGATVNGNYALIGGGMTYSGNTSSISNTVHAIDKSLTKLSVDSLHSGYTTFPCRAITVNGCSIFVKPETNESTTGYTVYDQSLVRTIQDLGKSMKATYSAAAVGDYAIFTYDGHSIRYCAEVFKTVDA